MQRLLRKATIIRATSPAQEGEPFLKDLRTEEDERQEQLMQTAWQGMREQQGEGMGAVAARRQGSCELDWSVHVLSSSNNGDELNLWPRPRAGALARSQRRYMAVSVRHSAGLVGWALSYTVARPFKPSS